MGKQKQIQGAQFVLWLGPVLDALRTLGGSGTPDEVVDHIAEVLKIPDEQLNETMASGELRFRNQVQWARFYLAREGYVDSSKRGVWRLTEKGRATHLTAEQARTIFLKWVKIFQEERKKRKMSEHVEEDVTEAAAGNSESFRERLLVTLRGLTPDAFERFSQELLREAGFVQVTVTGRSGDGGIDGHGTLQINPLVSFRVLFQCKRYSSAVAPSHVRDFRGAMSGRADKGIIITTGTFTAEATREAGRDGAPPIELIDSEKLIDMCQQLELGLKPLTTFEMDEQYFMKFQALGKVNKTQQPLPSDCARG